MLYFIIALDYLYEIILQIIVQQVLNVINTVKTPIHQYLTYGRTLLVNLPVVY